MILRKVIPCRIPGRTVTYAVKCVNKNKVVKKRAQRQTINEISLLKKMQYPFIAKLEAVFQDRRCIYLVTELLQGGVYNRHSITVRDCGFQVSSSTI